MIHERIGQYEVYRVATDMEALQDAVRDRVEDLETTRESLDAVGKLLPGYSAKLLCEPAMKTLGKVSLGKMLKVTGLALVVVIDDERFAPLKAQLSKRRRTMRPNGSIRKPAWLITREASQKMQLLRNKKLSPRQRKLIAKRAARARWSRRGEPATTQVESG